MSNNKRLFNYASDDIENDFVWTNFIGGIWNKGLPRSEFRRLKKQYQSDLGTNLKRAVIGQTLNGVDFKKHYIDRQVYILTYLWLEVSKFQNKLSLNQCVQLLEMMMKHLTPINQKLLYVKITSLFDWVDPITQQRLDRIKEELIKTADYTQEDYYKRHDLIGSFLDSDTWSKSNHLEKKAKWVANPTVKKTCIDEDLELIKSDGYITAYRGFVIKGNAPIRMIRKDDMAKDGDDFPYYKIQNASYGVSYTLDKFVAHFFAFYGDAQLRHDSKVNGKDTSDIRAVVGEYHIKTSDIFVYNNARNEREIVLRNGAQGTKNMCLPLLHHYEFFTDRDGNFDKTGGYSDSDKTRPNVMKSDYSPDRKIMRVM